MKANFSFFIFSLLIFFCMKSHGQLNGTITVPSASYPNLNAVFGALNNQGVGTGGLVINLSAGNAQTAPSGGYQLGSPVLNSSVSATKSITINGHGNTITAAAGSGSQDGIFVLSGLDYITFDSLHLQESAANTTAISQMEWGFALLKRNVTAPYDGCQHVAIKNCTVVLGLAGDASTAIYLNNHTAASLVPLPATGAVAADMHSHNQFYGNTINNCIFGISIQGANNGLSNKYNTIGIPFGNNITYGGNTALLTAAVLSLNDSCLTVKNNIFQINAAHDPVTVNGINPQAIGVSIKGARGQVLVDSNGFNLNSNTGSRVLVAGCNMSEATDSMGVFSFSHNELSGTNLNASGVLVDYFKGLNCMTVDFDSILVSNNTLHDINWGGTSSTVRWRGFYIQTATNHTFPVNILFSDNVTENVQLHSGWRGVVVEIIRPTVNPTKAILWSEGNKINGFQTERSMEGFVYGADTTYATGNKVQAITATSSIFGTSADLGYTLIDSDTIMNINSGLGFIGFTTGGGSYSLNRGYIANDTAVSTLVGARNAISVSNSLFTDLCLTGVSGMFTGIENTGLCYNNMISDFTAPQYAADDIKGISVGSFAGSKVYYNTINLSTVSSGADFGATGIWFSSGGILDLRNNIIHVNVTSAGNGIVAALRRQGGTSGTIPYNFSDSSNGNIYYAPQDNAYSFLYTEGEDTATLVNSYNLSNDPDFNTPCGLFKNFVHHDFASYTESNLSPAALPGMYAPSGASYAKEVAVATNGPVVSEDMEGVIRSLPSDAGALEFEGTPVSASSISIDSGSSMTLCFGDSLTLYAPPMEGFQYQWMLNGTALEGATDSMLTVYEEGAYSLVYTKGTCTTSTGTDTIVVYPQLAPSITVEDNVLSTDEYSLYQWYLNDAPISDANEQSYMVEEAGNYFVVVTDANGCSNSSDTLFIDPTSIEDVSVFVDPFIIYPNPNSGHFILKGKLAHEIEEVYVTVFDVLGVAIYQERCKIVGKKIHKEINLPATLAPGVYLLSVVLGSHGNQTNISFIKQ